MDFQVGTHTAGNNRWL